MGFFKPPDKTASEILGYDRIPLPLDIERMIIKLHEITKSTSEEEDIDWEVFIYFNEWEDDRENYDIRDELRKELRIMD